MFRVMLVEDEEIMLEGLKKTIPWEELGYSLVFSAKNGIDAYQWLNCFCSNGQCVDVVISDIRMPKMDGLTLLQKIKNQYPDTKVFLLSGYEDFEYARTAMKFGADEYILKVEIRKELEKVLTQYRAAMELEKQRNSHRIIEEYIRRILTGDKTPDIGNELFSEINRLSYQVISIRFECFHDDIEDNREHNNVISELLEKCSLNGSIVFWYRAHEYIIVLTNKYNETALFLQIRDKINLFLNELPMVSTPAVGLGRIGIGVQGLQQSYAEARLSVKTIRIGDLKNSVTCLST